MNQNSPLPVSSNDAAALNFLKSYANIESLRKSYIKLLLENAFNGNIKLVTEEEKDDIYFLWLFLEKMDGRCN